MTVKLMRLQIKQHLKECYWSSWQQYNKFLAVFWKILTHGFWSLPVCAHMLFCAWEPQALATGGLFLPAHSCHPHRASSSQGQLLVIQPLCNRMGGKTGTSWFKNNFLCHLGLKNHFSKLFFHFYQTTYQYGNSLQHGNFTFFFFPIDKTLK